MKVKIKLLNENAVIPFKTYGSDLCYDVVATSEEEIAPNVWRYGLGIALQIERGEDHIGVTDIKQLQHDYNVNIHPDTILSIDARPRSSVWKTGMVLSNCEGTIDEHYRGEICAIFYHVMPDMPRYKIGDKVCQIKLGATLPIEFVKVDELDNNTDRGKQGFGHTGLKYNNNNNK